MPSLGNGDGALFFTDSIPKGHADAGGQKQIVLFYSWQRVALEAVADGRLQTQLPRQSCDTRQVKRETILPEFAEVGVKHCPLRQGSALRELVRQLLTDECLCRISREAGRKFLPVV